jgi:predicted DNA-binding protein (MmcQ/YjbR family)
VHIDRLDTVGGAELKELIAASYRQVFDKLPAGVKKGIQTS